MSPPRPLDQAAVLDGLPPERLLSTDRVDLIRAGAACMRDVETVKQYVAFENCHANRLLVLELLAARAEELRAEGRLTATQASSAERSPAEKAGEPVSDGGERGRGSSASRSAAGSRARRHR